MTGAILPRSIHADRLGHFPEFVFGDLAAFGFSGKWREFFRRRIGPAYDGRVIGEIGCANAAFLGRIAAKYPMTGFVGVDWKCKAISDGARLIAGSGLKNIALLRARGQDMPGIFGERELDEIWVFHPDPCADHGIVGPRELRGSQSERLQIPLIGEPFLLDVHNILRDRASLLAIKTDHPGYYQRILGLFGLPEPHWFQAARKQGATGDRKSNHGIPMPYPRVRPGDLMPPGVAPSPSEALRGCFDVAMHSADFWHDPAALAHTTDRCFSGEATAFESRFIRKRFPIYYFEVRGLRNILRCVPSNP
jgi:tRNA G46 methylase TrmB